MLRGFLRQRADPQGDEHRHPRHRATRARDLRAASALDAPCLAPVGRRAARGRVAEISPIRRPAIEPTRIASKTIAAPGAPAPGMPPRPPPAPRVSGQPTTTTTSDIDPAMSSGYSCAGSAAAWPEHEHRALEGGRHADGATSCSARLSSSTFTRGSPRNPSVFCSVWCVDQRLHLVEREPADGRDPRRLELAPLRPRCPGRARCRRTVSRSTGMSADREPGRVRRSRPSGPAAACCRDVVGELLRARAEVRAGRRRGVVVDRRGPSVEPLRARPLLADQRAADRLAVHVDERAVRPWA